MKMKIFALILVIAISLLALASCGDKGNSGKNCQHTFDTEWTTSDTEHWHAATCEHGEFKNMLAKHSDDNQDGKCDVCEYEVGHKHTYESGWTFDEKHHWKKSTCLHKDEKGDLSLHVDEKKDGVCDVCSGHVHQANAAGFCTIEGCGKQTGEVDETDLTALVNAVMLQKYHVNGGNISYDFKGPSNTGAAYVANKLDTVNYIFGKDDFTYVKVQSHSENGGTITDGVYETWHQLIGEDETFGIIKQDNNDFELDMSNAEKLNGYYIAISTFVGDYGVENTLYQLYLAALGQDLDEEDNITGSLVGSLETDIDSDGNKVTFKYYYKTLIVNSSNATDPMTGKTEEVHNVNLFAVEVSFSYNDDYALTELTISCDCFTNDPGTSKEDGFLVADVDLDYDPDTGVCTLRENALADNYTIVVTQTAGERTRENENPQSEFIPDDFDFYLTETEDELTGEYSYSDLLVGNTVNANVNSFVKLYVRNCTPEGTSLHKVWQLVTFKLFKDGVEIENPDDFSSQTAFASFTFHGEQRLFMILPKAEGTYKLIVYINNNVAKEINIIVGKVNINDVVVGENEFAVEVTEPYSWSNPYTFTANQAGTYTFTLPAGVGFVDADEYDRVDAENNKDEPLVPGTSTSSIPYPDPYFDFQEEGNGNGGSFSLDLAAGQTVRFYVSAANTGIYVISYSVA